MNKSLKIGILGTSGLAAKQAIFAPIKRRDDIQVKAIASRDFNKAKGYAHKYKIPDAYGSYDALLEDKELDAVYIPLPNHLHCHWTIKVLEAGKHVLCEKPISANAEEAEKMYKTAKQSGLILMEGLHFPYHPLLNHLKEIVSGGKLGKIKKIDVKFCLNLEKNNMRFFYDLAGGTTMDVGCYCIELMRFLLGSEPAIQSAEAKLIREQIDGEMRAKLLFPEDIEGTMYCSLQSKPWNFRLVATIIGSEGTLKVINPFLPHIFNFVQINTNTERSWWHQFPRGESTYWHQLNAFIAAIEKREEPLTGGSNAINNIKVIDDIYRKAGLKLRQGAAQ